MRGLTPGDDLSAKPPGLYAPPVVNPAEAQPRNLTFLAFSSISEH